MKRLLPALFLLLFSSLSHAEYLFGGQASDLQVGPDIQQKVIVAIQFRQVQPGPRLVNERELKKSVASRLTELGYSLVTPQDNMHVPVLNIRILIDGDAFTITGTIARLMQTIYLGKDEQGNEGFVERVRLVPLWQHQRVLKQNHHPDIAQLIAMMANNYANRFDTLYSKANSQE